LFKIPDMGFAPCGYTCEYFCVYVSLRLSLKLTSIVSSLRIANRSPTLICKPHKDFNTRVSANKSTRKRSKSRQGNWGQLTQFLKFVANQKKKLPLGGAAY
jgi:hypothetical protein